VPRAPDRGAPLSAGAKGQVVFDLESALSKKEHNQLRKMEPMIQYHLARTPLWGSRESPQWAAAEKLKEGMATIQKKARARFDEQHGIF